LATVAMEAGAATADMADMADVAKIAIDAHSSSQINLFFTIFKMYIEV